MINKALTTISNMFCNLNLTDMETCYKVFRTDLLKSIPIRSDRFGFEPEIVMKSAKRKLRIYEVPISYHGRTYEEGKKIGWKDGIKALGVISEILADRRSLRRRLYGRAFLNNLTGTPQYLNWLTRVLRPYIGDTVLEVGAGIGNISARLMARRSALCGRREGSALPARPSQPLPAHSQCHGAEDGSRMPGRFRGVSRNLRYGAVRQCSRVRGRSRRRRYPFCTARSRPGGALIVLVPQGRGLYGSLDRAMGHKRRFQREEADAPAAGRRDEGGENPQLEQDQRAFLVALQPRAAALRTSTRWR